MANGYVTLDGLNYDIVWKTYDDYTRPSRKTSTTLTGKTLLRKFNFTNYRWSFVLSVKYSEARVGYGDLDDLRATHALDYTTFIDPFGSSYDVYFEGEFPVSHEQSLSFETIPLDVPISLRRRQT